MTMEGSDNDHRLSTVLGRGQVFYLSIFSFFFNNGCFLYIGFNPAITRWHSTAATRKRTTSGPNDKTQHCRLAVVYLLLPQPFYQPCAYMLTMCSGLIITITPTSAPSLPFTFLPYIPFPITSIPPDNPTAFWSSRDESHTSVLTHHL